MKKTRIIVVISILIFSLMLVSCDSAYSKYIEDLLNSDIESGSAGESTSVDSEVPSDDSHSAKDEQTDDIISGAEVKESGNFSTAKKTAPSADRIKQMGISYSTYNTGSSYTKSRLEEIKKSAEKIKGLGSLVYEGAADMMAHYLDGTGTDYILDMNKFLSDSTALANRNSDINAALRAAEIMASDGKKININQVEESIHHNLTGDYKYCVGSYFANVQLLDVTVKNGVYSAKIKYSVDDFYNWDSSDVKNIFDGIAGWIVGDISPADLCQLHKSGVAKDFLTHGEITYRASWVKGQDASNIRLEAVK